MSSLRLVPLDLVLQDLKRGIYSITHFGLSLPSLVELFRVRRRIVFLELRGIRQLTAVVVFARSGNLMLELAVHLLLAVNAVRKVALWLRVFFAFVLV